MPILLLLTESETRALNPGKGRFHTEFMYGLAMYVCVGFWQACNVAIHFL